MRLLTLDDQPVDLIKVQQRLLGNYSHLQIDMCGIIDRLVSKNTTRLLFHLCRNNETHTSHSHLNVMTHLHTCCDTSLLLFLSLAVIELINFSYEVLLLCVMFGFKVVFTVMLGFVKKDRRKYSVCDLFAFHSWFSLKHMLIF